MNANSERRRKFENSCWATAERFNLCCFVPGSVLYHLLIPAQIGTFVLVPPC